MGKAIWATNGVGGGCEHGVMWYGDNLPQCPPIHRPKKGQPRVCVHSRTHARVCVVLCVWLLAQASRCTNELVRVRHNNLSVRPLNNLHKLPRLVHGHPLGAHKPKCCALRRAPTWRGWRRAPGRSHSPETPWRCARRTAPAIHTDAETDKQAARHANALSARNAN